MGNNQSCDVVIIGAGFAGITASRELSRRGYDVVVLEGRDRIGGRTWYKDDALPGHSLELGGTWVHWFQPHAFAEISRYNLELVETIGVSAPEIAATVTGGRRKSVPYEEASSAIESLMEMVVQDAREVLERPFEPFFHKDALEVIDKLSIQDRIDGLDLTPEEKDLANGLWTAMGSAPCGDVGLVAALRWYALSGFDINAVFDTVGRYKLKNGTRSLIQAIADDSSAEIRLSTPVAAVEQSDDGVVVTTRQGDTLRARYVVVAAPLNTFGAIDFSPPLSAAKQAGISEGQPGRGSKAWVHVRGDLPKPFFAVAPENHLINYVVTDKVLDDGQLLIAFGPEGADLNAGDIDQVGAELQKLFGDLEVVATTGHDWASDEFSRGTWCMFRPGQTTRLLAELQKPEGRVFFAGSDLANGWNGFIDGAIESGIRADREIHARISGNPS
ncbi:monoamine oxidase [Rhodococcus wratislaviensis]|uniref:Oxidoreductase n=2 Tax=Rhodococcus wratislaviensis TaxID=44752 RepID=A0AB38FK29_RHOWR|nr:NAD(P)/FAD-dependent oxidoreductase [Rhodococcus wratislaviensis]REE74748.1 monoamine oxidase [Rhodococcus wratislaviensis]GAF48207.1 putative oxidoreductase [Rhodococcus wratislaviensis NBRC 100605]SPZ41710.1 oxidoreductase [Rhodococcus wratislaviensis]